MAITWRTVRTVLSAIAERLPDRRSVFGLTAIAVVVAGVWGLWGWQWAAIGAGLPPAAFYLFGELRSLRTPTPTEVD